MTDRPGAAGPAGPDRVADTLTALRSDIDSIPLAESGAVRRRGELRTRHQIVGSTLVVAAVVAGAIGIGAGLTGDDKVLAPPADPPSTTATQESSAAETPETPVTDVPDSALMTADDLAAADVPGLIPVTKGPDLVGIETLNPCLLGSGDLVDGGQAAFGTGRTVAASQMVLTQRTAEAATNQIAGYDADIVGCTTREGAPAGMTVTTPDSTTADQRAMIDQLGPDAYVYYLEDGSTTSWVLGTRTANAGGYFAFDSGTFTLDQALQATVAARERMAATYGE
jgi:hypothetical protein